MEKYRIVKNANVSSYMFVLLKHEKNFNTRFKFHIPYVLNTPNDWDNLPAAQLPITFIYG